MGDSGTPLTRRELEAKIQDAEKEIASIQFELDAVVDEAQDILDKLRYIYMKLQSGPKPQEKQKLLEEEEILKGDPLYDKYWATYKALRNAEQERGRSMRCLKMLKVIEALPATPLPENSALETAALLHGDKSAESKSLSSSSLL